MVPEDLVELHDLKVEFAPAVTDRLAKYWRQFGVLPSWRIGRRVFFSKADVVAYIEAGYRPSRTP